MTSEADFPLDRPLPPDVAASEAGFIDYYQKYAAFSWPWSWRRTAIFGSLCVLAAFSFGVSHALTVKDWSEGAAVGWRIGAANLVLVGAGPVLAAAVRHAKLARRLEVALVVCAILGGMVLTSIGNSWAFGFHDREMAAHGRGGSPPPPRPERPDMSWWMQRGLSTSYLLLLWFIASGGLALRPYLAEPRRWADHQRRRALEALSLQKSTADLRLAVLQAQVEPHFLFNTLASVRSLIHSDPARAAQTIDALADHLRATLPRLRADTGAVLSTLGAQFAICESYLKLMQVRLGERLHVEIRLPMELREVPFPPLMLISLVENAIKHGVEPKAGASHVMLAAAVHDTPGGARLEVEVADDGAGLHLGMGEGTGLANIRAQLLTRFDSAASLDLLARESGGMAARLMLPMEQLRA